MSNNIVNKARLDGVEWVEKSHWDLVDIANVKEIEK